jgi:hypothetical protein
MKTFSELKSFCEKNNIRYEINPRYSKATFVLQPVIDENGDIRFTTQEHRTFLGYEIGMNNIAGRKGKSEWNWVWFETLGIPKDLTDDTLFCFRERYSQNNGKSNKGWREELNAENTIENRM